MIILTLFWGIFIGLMVTAPLGPVNIICIRRSLAKGAMSAFTVGLGAAVADSIFGGFALLSLNLVTGILTQSGGYFKIIGGMIVLGVGVKLILTHPHLTKGRDGKMDRFKAAVAVFFLTLTNPMTILAFLAIFATLGLGGTTVAAGEEEANIIEAVLLITGIFLGCALWWGILAAGVSKFRSKVDDAHLLWINRISGSVVILIGLYTVISQVFML